MPTISRFFGIVIFMNYNDHDPPHFHARYGDEEVVVHIRTSAVHGTISKRALRMILEWTDLHKVALLRNWDLARERKPLEPVPPLN